MKNLIEIHDLHFKFQFRSKLIEGLSLELKEAEILGLVGANGSGKSTLISLMNGHLQPREGTLKVLDESSNSINRKKLNELVTISHSIDLSYFSTIDEYLTFIRPLYPKYSVEKEQELLKKFKLKSTQSIRGLSQGEQKKLQIVSAFSSFAKIILVDEITAVLDPWSRDFFYELVKERRKEQQTSFIIATNIIGDLNNLADSIYILKSGKEQIVKTISADQMQLEEA